jgi:hypothetical protein
LGEQRRFREFFNPDASSRATIGCVVPSGTPDTRLLRGAAVAQERRVANVLDKGESAKCLNSRRLRIRIDPEFHALIPALTPVERTQLEENIVTAARAMDPLVPVG